MSGKTESEMLAYSISEMKRDALAHFGKWRANVLRRTSDIVIKNGGTGGNIGGQGLQQASGNVGGRGPQQMPGNVGGQGPQQTPGNARRPGLAFSGKPPRPSGKFFL